MEVSLHLCIYIMINKCQLLLSNDRCSGQLTALNCQEGTLMLHMQLDPGLSHQNWSPQTNFGSQNWSPLAKNSPPRGTKFGKHICLPKLVSHAKLRVYTHACMHIDNVRMMLSSSQLARGPNLPGSNYFAKISQCIIIAICMASYIGDRIW